VWVRGELSDATTNSVSPPIAGERDTPHLAILIALPPVCLPANRFRFLERTFIINTTPPTDVLFSHPVAEQAQNDTPVSHMAHENLFREPAFAPGTQLPETDEPAPVERQHNAPTRPRRTTRRRTAA
jgi:hypothetical protein